MKTYAPNSARPTITVRLPRVLAGASLIALAAMSVAEAQTTLYFNDFQNTTAHPDWSGWGTVSVGVSGGSITSTSAYINPAFPGSRVWTIDGTLSAGTTAAGPWSIIGRTPLLTLATNNSTTLSEITFGLQLSPNIYTAQATRVFLWDGVNFSNRLVSPSIFPGFTTNYSWTLDTFTQVGTGLGGASFSSVVMSAQLDGQTWAWGSADNYKALYVDNISFVTTAIPEPSTFSALAGLGALGLVALRRRSRRG
jgi:hypothetical protein